MTRTRDSGHGDRAHGRSSAGYRQKAVEAPLAVAKPVYLAGMTAPTLLGLQRSVGSASVVQAVRQSRDALQTRSRVVRSAPPIARQRTIAQITTPTGQREVDYQDDPPFKAGGDGTVHMGKVFATGQQVVVKKAKGEDGQAGLQGETRARGEMGSPPNIVPVVGWNSDQHLLVLERAEGSLVAENALASRKFEERVHLALGALTGLIHVHAHDWSHGDLNLKNILISGGRSMLADFGAAKRPEMPDAIPLEMRAFVDPDTRAPEERRTVRINTDRRAMAQAVYNIVMGNTSDAIIPSEETMASAVRYAGSPVPEPKRDSFVALVRKHRNGVEGLPVLDADLRALLDG